MQFKPNYQPFHQAIHLLVTSLTNKQQAKYNSLSGYFADRLLKVSKSKAMQTKIAEVESVKDKCQEDYYSWFDQFQTDYSGPLKAKVDWFDRNRGLGMITVFNKDGTDSVRSDIYACNIKGKKTWYPETACVYYEEGQEVEVELTFHGYLSPIFVCGLTPGHLDREGWDRIKDKGLAFRCDEDGNAINGLFA